MGSTHHYLTGLVQRLADDRFKVSREELGLVGYRAQTRALTRIHLFVVAAGAEAVDENRLAEFSGAAVALAVTRQGEWGGFQSAVVVLPVLVAERADEGAVAITQRPHRLAMGGFAVMAQPSLIDVGAGRAHIFRGTRVWGALFNTLIKQKLTLLLPDPTSEAVPDGQQGHS